MWIVKVLQVDKSPAEAFFMPNGWNLSAYNLYAKNKDFYPTTDNKNNVQEHEYNTKKNLQLSFEEAEKPTTSREELKEIEG